MDVNREVALQEQVEHENRLNSQSLNGGVLTLEDNFQEEESPSIAISIVSNSRLLSEGLPALLSPHVSVRLIGCYLGDRRISSPPNPQGHVVLLDSSVGRAAAIAWTRHWRGLIPPAYVLILEMANDIDLILTCIEAGASGYTLQGVSAVEVAQAIKGTHSGLAHCSPEVTAQLYARVTSLKDAVRQLSVPPLTARESEILRYIAAGYTNLEIASQLVVELRTVKQHVHNILGKLSARSRGEAVRFAAEQGWLDSDSVAASKSE